MFCFCCKKIDTKKFKNIDSIQEKEFLEFLEKTNFEKHLKKISKKYKNKKIIIYGAGVFFQVIEKHYDLSELNIIAVADRKFFNHEQEERFRGYLVCAPDEITTLEADYVLIATKKVFNTIEFLQNEVLKGTGIKLNTLINKSFIALIKEILED